jgi:hypothetical protein
MVIQPDLRGFFALRVNPITTETAIGTITICKSK